MKLTLSLLMVLLVSLVVLAPRGTYRQAPALAAPASGDPGEVRALLMVCNQYGANYNLIRDVMELYGWDITTVGVTATVTPCYYGDAITVDTLVSEIADVSQFDVLAIMTSRVGSFLGAHRQLLQSTQALDLVSDAVAESLLVAALCSGTRVLAAADVINGVRVTGSEDYLDEYLAAGAIWEGETGLPVLDGNILTCTRNQINSRRICEIIRRHVAEKRAGAR